MELENKVSRLNMENNRNRDALEGTNEVLIEKESQINILKQENRDLSFYQNEYQNLKIEYEQKEQLLIRQTNEIRTMQGEI